MKFRRRALVSSSLIAVALAAPATAAPRMFDLPAQSASAAIRAFAAQANVQVLSPAASVSNKRTQEVRGVMEPDQALKQMLRGTSLRSTVTPSGAIVIAQRAEKSAAERPKRIESAPAAAAETIAAAEPLQADANAGGEIVVTGSRLAVSGYSTPTPVSVVDRARLEKLGFTNVAAGLNDLPSFRPSTTPQANLYFTNTNIGANIVDLRGLGPNRTLVLVDGRRFVPSNAQGTVDLNLIPSALVQRSEVVTGGASAAYGADAVAGVVNLILDTKLQGLRAEASYGQTDRNDVRTYHASMAGGTKFAGGRGHIIAGFEYEKSGPSGTCYSRTWCASNTRAVTNTSPGAGGLPAQIMSHDVNFAFSRGGTISSGPLKGTQFAPDGTPQPFQYGAMAGALFMVGGDADGGKLGLSNEYLLQVPVKRYSFLSHAEFEVTDRLSLFAEGSYGRAEGSSINISRFNLSTPYYRDNPYLPAATQAAMDLAGVTSFQMSRHDDDLGPQRAFSRNSTFRFAGGFSGSFGSDWKYDGYYEYGRNRGSLTINNNIDIARFNLAVDAVQGANGQVVCRSTLTNPSNGCQPLNLFGRNRWSQSAKDYVYGSSFQTRNLTQQTGGLNLSGSLFDTGAGSVTAAVGVERRILKVSGAADAVSIAQGWYNNTGQPIAGTQKITEFYAEAAVPLADRAAFAHKLELNGAVRRTHYNLSGSVTPWKVGAVYEPVSGVRFRATRSRDLRAPNLDELFAAEIARQISVIDPRNNSTGVVISRIRGNPALQPERANTLTAGVVLQPKSGLFDRLRLSVDYYNIKISGVIAAVDLQSVVNRCNAGISAFCGSVIRSPAGAITDVVVQKLNLNRLKTDGFEIAANYRLPLSDLGMSSSSSLNFDVAATNIRSLKTIDTAGVAIDRAGQTVSSTGGVDVTGAPKWSVTTVVTYAQDRFSVSGEANFISRGIYDPTLIGPHQDGYSVTLPNSISNNRVPSRTYFNLATQYKIVDNGTRSVELFATVRNVLNKSPADLPPFALASYFDVLGRRYNAGIRVKY